MLESGGQRRFDNRVAWTLTHLAQAGLLSRPKRGITRITDRGLKVLAECPDRVDVTLLNRCSEYREFRKRNSASGDAAPVAEVESRTPEEVIQAAVVAFDAQAMSSYACAHVWRTEARVMAARTKEQRTERWQLRVPVESDALVREAAEACHEDLTNFVEQAAVQRARDTLADRNVFRVDAAAYDEFIRVLDRPPHETPMLRRLLSRPAPWE